MVEGVVVTVVRSDERGCSTEMSGEDAEARWRPELGGAR
jgi:hypothetical protein